MLEKANRCLSSLPIIPRILQIPMTVDSVGRVPSATGGFREMLHTHPAPPQGSFPPFVFRNEGSFNELTGIYLRASKPLIQLGPAPLPRDILHGDGDGLTLADNHHQTLAAGDPGIEQVALKHGVVLRQDRDDDGGIFRSLAFVNRRGVGQYQRIEFSERCCQRNFA